MAATKGGKHFHNLYAKRIELLIVAMGNSYNYIFSVETWT